MKRMLRIGWMLLATISYGPAFADDDKDSNATSGDSSQLVVGAWKFAPSADSNHPEKPKFDTEFRFINPTTKGTANAPVTIEYAFFELDGTFCGCDRDQFNDNTKNRTVIYTVLQESMTATPVPAGSITHLFSCSGTSGALKSIVFQNHGQKIFFGGETQVGFQTHAFGGIDESDILAGTSNVLMGSVMTEAGLEGVALTKAAREEVEAIHDLCVTVQGPL